MIEFIAATLVLSVFCLLTIAYQIISASLIIFGARLLRGKVSEATARIDRLIGCAISLAGIWLMVIQFTVMIG